MTSTSRDLHALAELLVVLSQCSPADEGEFAHEHIHEARTCLLGAMPAEFGLNIELAKEALARMTDTEARRKAQRILASWSRI